MVFYLVMGMEVKPLPYMNNQGKQQQQLIMRFREAVVCIFQKQARMKQHHATWHLTTS